MCLILIFLFLALSVPSFADNNLINSQDLSNWEVYADDNISFSYSSGVSTVTVPTGSGQQLQGGGYQILTYYIFEAHQLAYSHTFKFDFDFKSSSVENRYVVKPALLLLNQDDSIYSVQLIGSAVTMSRSWATYSFTFVPSSVFPSIPSDKKIAISFSFVGGDNSASNYNTKFYFQNIALTDFDDNSGFLTQISNAIAYLHIMLDEAMCKIVGGTTISGVTYNGFFNDLATWLNNVKQGIVNKLTEVKNGIIDKLEAVKTAIGDFFTMLKNYLLYFKHPVTLNNDGVPVDSQGNPVYENPFEEPEIFDTLDEWVETIDEAKDTTEDSADEGLSHISGVMGIITTLFTRVPFLSIFFGFVLAVVIIKKVTGR